jgi:alpha-L-arabinofuranosidase
MPRNRSHPLRFECLETRRMLAAVTWTGTVSSDWETAGNWSDDAVPSSSTGVAIQSSEANVTIGSGETASVGSLTIDPGATLSLTGAGNLTVPASNVLTNSDFESPTASNSATSPGTWWTWGAAYLSTQYAYTGSQSLVLSGTNTGVAEPFTYTAGDSYTASVYAMTPAAGSLGAAGVYLQVLFFNSSGDTIDVANDSPTMLTSSSASGGPLAGSVGSEGWNHFYTTVVAPSGASSAQVQLEFYSSTANSGVVYCDDFTFGPAASGPSSLAAASISNSGTLSVGAANSVTVSGAYSQSSTGTLGIQLGGGPSTNEFGTLTITAAATLAGTLQATIVDGYAPATTDTFTPISYAGETGSFASDSMPSGSGYQFHAAVTFTNVTLSAAPTSSLTATVNASSGLHGVSTNLLGMNMVYWDPDTGTSQTEQMLTAAGLDIFRFPGGSASDDYHFNQADNYYDGAQTFIQFVEAITAEGGTGLVTIDYGSGSPQEAAAELAYLDGSTSDNTVIGNGIEWNDSAGAWETVNWQTVAYWASLRGATPLKTDDGLNFLRIDHPAPFTDIKYWEVGNEEYGSWEVDHHGTATPGGASTGAQHDPATYAAFAEQFATLAKEIQTSAGLPQISIGIDSDDPTGTDYNGWTTNVLKDGLADGFVPAFISDHNYMQAPGDESDSFLLDDTVSDGASILDWSTRYADYETLLSETVGSQASSVQIMGTEFNSVYTNPGKQSTSLVNGLFIADSLGSLLDSGYTGGFVWDLRNSWTTSGENNSNLLYGWREGGDYGQLGDPNVTNGAPSTGPYVAYPGYYALELGSKIIASGGEVVSAASNYADLNVYAVKESSGDLELLVINTNPGASLTEQFDLSGFQPSGAAVVWQYGETQDTAQSESSTGASALANSNVTLSLTGGDFSYSFPAYSMTVLDLKPQIFTSVAISPTSVSMSAGSQQFSATALDQFGHPMESQPAFTWSVTGGGVVTSGGFYTPPYASGSATVEASSGGKNATATITYSGYALWLSSSAAAWTAASNWGDTSSSDVIPAPGVRGIAGDTIELGPSALGAVELNGASPNIAAITFTGSTSATIVQGTGGSLELYDGPASATATVAAGAHTISAPVVLGSSLVVQPAAGSQLTISGGISGVAQSLTESGPGTLVLSGADSYTGGTSVTAGKLVLDSSSAIAAGTSLTAGANTAAIFPGSPVMAAAAAHPSALAATAGDRNVTPAVSPAAWSRALTLGPPFPKKALDRRAVDAVFGQLVG